MADPIRYLILTQLKAALSAISTASGYHGDVTTVEIVARGFDDADVRPETMPWIGIIPQTENDTDRAFDMLDVEWPIDIIAHFQVSDRTDTGVALACMQWTSDIRKAIYSDVTLGIEGVINGRITNRTGSEGSQEAIKQGLASVQIRASYAFEEGVSDD